MKVLFCGGGTAGHINPAIAVAEELINQDKNASILFIGREDGKENGLIIKAGFELKTIKIQGLKRSFSPENLKRITTAIKAKKKAEEIIREYRPDVILGTGGYVCWPVIIAGHKMGIPAVLHESNISPGLTTKLLCRKCKKILLGNKETEKLLNKNVETMVVGNPLRGAFGKISRNNARAKIGVRPEELLIVSFGGSIGAERINEVIMEIIEKHSSVKKEIKHIHATGERYFLKNKEKAKEYQKNGCRILPFIEDMPTVLHAADIVICRSGAMTLAELSAVGVASILIPSPNVTDNHQYKNAKQLCDADAAVMIEEKNLSAETLEKLLIDIENDKNGRKTKAKNIKALSTPNSAKMIINELFALKKSAKNAAG